MALYKFKIHHVKGLENTRADALSRRPDYAEGKEKTVNFQLFKKENDTLVYTQPQVNITRKYRLSSYYKPGEDISKRKPRYLEPTL